MRLDPQTEPVRVSGWTALLLGLTLTAIILFAAGTPPLGIAGALAAMALTSIGGLEFARNQVTPVKHARLPDGHAEEDL